MRQRPMSPAEGPRADQAAAPAPSQQPADSFEPIGAALRARPAEAQSIDGIVEGLMRRAAEVATPFPQPMRAGLVDAMQTSAQRLRTGLATGRIDANQAGAGLEMMRELYEGLDDLRSGRATVTVHPTDDAGTRVWNMVAPDGDAFRVVARRSLDASGEARIGLRQTMDDGMKLRGRHRVAMRVDLERFGQASVDLQFGGSGLDKSIHGLMKNPDGSVFTTETGKKLADHHFRDHLPDAIETPETFGELVKAFRTGVMAPLEQAR